ncbi:hypothetical protein J6590_065181 [Homalodisca vitripennis]|nr:hypothetical protein J6590_065181 [Homalodisca vitripennis]
MDFPRNEDIHSYNTRGALNYPLPTHRTTHFSKKPSYLGRKVLNSLPQNLKNLRGNELKRRHQDWLVERPVYTINEFYNIYPISHPKGLNGGYVAGEEARNPSRAIPVSIIVSLLIIFLAYFGVSSVLTLMWPYYLQDVGAPLTHVFTELGLDWANWVVTIGGLFGLSASLIGGMFPLPRVLYAMSKDGLLFKFLSRVHPRFKTPFVATILSGILIGTMAFMFSLKDLFDLMSMTSLVGYNLVSISALVLKYRTEAERQLQEFTSDSESSPLLQSSTFKRFTQPFERKGKGPHKSPFASTGFTVFILTVACGLLAFTLASMQNVASVLTLSPSSSFSSSTMSPYFAYILVLIIAFILIMFKRIPDHSTSTKHPKKFQTPGSPFTQTFNIFVNIYLMCHIDLSIWYRLFILLAAGLVIYFIYGLRHSNENQNRTLSQVEYEKLQYIEEIQSGEVSTAQVINSQVVDAQHVNLGVTVVRI